LKIEYFLSRRHLQAPRLTTTICADGLFRSPATWATLLEPAAFEKIRKFLLTTPVQHGIIPDRSRNKHSLLTYTSNGELSKTVMLAQNPALRFVDAALYKIPLSRIHFLRLQNFIRGILILHPLFPPGVRRRHIILHGSAVDQHLSVLPTRKRIHLRGEEFPVAASSGPRDKFNGLTRLHSKSAITGLAHCFIPMSLPPKTRERDAQGAKRSRGYTQSGTTHSPTRRP